MAIKELCDMCNKGITGKLLANDARLDITHNRSIYAVRVHSIGNKLCFKCMQAIVAKGKRARTGEEARLRLDKLS